MYRLVHCRMWRRGGSFRRLSGPKTPNAQHLWFYLLTGDVTTPIPGVIVIEREVLAFRLNWKAGIAFDRCVQEIVDAGMIEVDWRGGLIWCPAAFDYNKAPNPNVVKSWSKYFDLLPESPLKVTIWQTIEEHCRSRGEGFVEVFQEGFPEGFPERFDERFLSPVPDTVPDPEPSQDPPKKKGRTSNRQKVDDGFDRFWEVWPKKVAKSRAKSAWDRAVKERRIVLDIFDGAKKAVRDEQITIDALIRNVEERGRLDRQWIKDDGEYIPNPATFINQSRWLDQWVTSNRHLPQEPPDDPVWRFGTYRHTDYNKHGTHKRWADYTDYAVTMPPRTAEPFTEWLDKQTKGDGT